LGLARIAIAVLAVVLAVGLLIVGGIALWGALGGKGSAKSAGASAKASATSSAGKPGKSGRSRGSVPPAPNAPSSRIGNTVELHCLAAQCPVYVAGPGPTDVQFHGNLVRNERRLYNETRLTVVVDDVSKVVVTINGREQPRGRPGESKTYDVGSAQ
jgi:hypothetical protein